MRPLTAKQERFIQEYLVDLNATQAAIRAGYSPLQAGANAARTLSSAAVRERLEEEMDKRVKKLGVSQERIIRELVRIAFVNAADVVNLDDTLVASGATRDDTAALSVKSRKLTVYGDVKCEVRTADKLKALELLSKHLGLLRDGPNPREPGGYEQCLKQLEEKYPNIKEF